MTRAANQQLCDEFRKLLTDRFKELADDMAEAVNKHVDSDVSLDDIASATKPWRGELWAKFAEIERRLCPQPEQ